MLQNNLFYGASVPIVLLHTRGVGLMVGCALAATLHHHGEWFRSSGLISARGGQLAAVLAGLLFVVMTIQSTMIEACHPATTMMGWWVPVFDLAIGIWIVNLWTRPDCKSMRWIGLPPLSRIGKISYGMYLYHMLALVLVWHVVLADIQHWPSVPKFFLRLVLYFGVTVGISALS